MEPSLRGENGISRPATRPSLTDKDHESSYNSSAPDKLNQRSASSYSTTTPWDIFRIVPVDTKDFDETNRFVEAFKQIAKCVVYLVTFLLVLVTSVASMGILLLLTANLNNDNFDQKISVARSTPHSNNTLDAIDSTQIINFQIKEVCLYRTNTAKNLLSKTSNDKTNRLKRKFAKSLQSSKTHIPIYALYERTPMVELLETSNEFKENGIDVSAIQLLSNQSALDPFRLNGLRWLWAILLCMTLPSTFVLIRSLRQTLFHTTTSPTWTTLGIVFGMETLHIIGVCMYVLIVLPQTDSLQGLIIMYSFCIIPALLQMLSRDNSATTNVIATRWIKVGLDGLSLIALVGGLVMWPLLTRTASPQNVWNGILNDGTSYSNTLSSNIIWVIPLSAILISLTWWENFVDTNTAKLFGFKTLVITKDLLKRSRAKTYIFVSIWKIILSVCIISGFALFKLNYNFFDVSTIFENPSQTLRTYRKLLWPLFLQSDLNGNSHSNVYYFSVNPMFVEFLKNESNQENQIRTFFGAEYAKLVENLNRSPSVSSSFVSEYISSLRKRVSADMNKLENNVWLLTSALDILQLDQGIMNLKSLIGALKTRGPAFFQITDIKEEAAKLGIHKLEYLLGITLFASSNISPSMIWSLVLTQVCACLICYYVSKFTCKVKIQGFSFALPLTLSIPVLVSIIGLSCVYEQKDPCSMRSRFIPDNVFWKCQSDTNVIYKICGVWMIWILAQFWITLHIWFPKVERLAKTEKLFISPMYCPIALVQSLSLNRRRDRKRKLLRRAFSENEKISYGIYDEDDLDQYHLEEEDELDDFGENVLWHRGSRAFDGSLMGADGKMRTLKANLADNRYGPTPDKLLQKVNNNTNISSKTSNKPTVIKKDINGNNIYASIESLEKHLDSGFKSSSNNSSGNTDQDLIASLGPSEDINNGDDSTIRIYICATMWHETADEMTQVLKSIFRMDEDQSARRKAEKFLKVADPDYYEFEAHIFVDEAFDENEHGQRTINSFVRQLISVVDIAASAVHRTPMRLAPPKKYIMPYGGKLTWNLPGRNTLNVHLKDRTKIRNKKRWSQVMYMYYLLGQKLWVQIDDIQRKQIRADNTFILTLDGDVDVKPAAAQLLIDLMKKNHKVGAACGRIHPVGSGPMVWYQKFEYAIGHWFQKATEHMIGCVLCSPGCFSLFRASALMDDNVMRKYASKSEKAMHYVQYDQGEDRWLSTLLLQQGYRVEYCAAADAFTHAPEGFFEFYNQRRRWIPSTLANILDLLCSHTKTIQMNDSISLAYIAYQWALLACALIGPGTIFLMIVGAVALVFHINLWKSFALNLVPIACFVFVCLCTNSETQLLIAAFLSACYALLMISVSVGISVQITDDGLTSPSSIFLFVFVGCFFIAALLHPQEFWNIAYGILYFLAIPAMYLLLIIYSLTNLHVVQWGTREVPGADKIDRLRAHKRRKRLHDMAKSRWKALKLRYLSDKVNRIQDESRIPLLVTNKSYRKNSSNSLADRLDLMAQQNLPHYGYLKDLLHNKRDPFYHPLNEDEGINHDNLPNKPTSPPALLEDLLEAQAQAERDEGFEHLAAHEKQAAVMRKLSKIVYASSSSSSECESDLDSCYSSDNSDVAIHPDDGFAFNCGTLCRLTCCVNSPNKRTVVRKHRSHRHRNKKHRKAHRIDPYLLTDQVDETTNLLSGSHDNFGTEPKTVKINGGKKTAKQVRIDMNNSIIASSPGVNKLDDLFWVNDKNLKKGELLEVTLDEETFWKELIETYLYPLDEDDEHKIKIKSDLKSLRNKVILGFYMVNACFILIIFLLQLRKDKIFIEWPWGKRIDSAKVGGDGQVLDDESYEDHFESLFVNHDNKQYLKLEPIALVFLVVFMFLLITQFIAMLAHRFSTFQLILATTELKFLKCCSKRRGLSRFRSGLKKGKDGTAYPPQLTAEQAVALVRELQKLEGLDDEIEYEASINENGGGGINSSFKNPMHLPYPTNLNNSRGGRQFDGNAPMGFGGGRTRESDFGVGLRGRRSVAQNLAKNMTIRADGRLTTRKYTTNTLDAAFAKRFLALSEKINNPKFNERLLNEFDANSADIKDYEHLALNYDMEQNSYKYPNNGIMMFGNKKQTFGKNGMANKIGFLDNHFPNGGFSGDNKSHFNNNNIESGPHRYVPANHHMNQQSGMKFGMIRADRNTLRVLANKKDTIFRRDILDELKKETLKLGPHHIPANYKNNVSNQVQMSAKKSIGPDCKPTKNILNHTKNIRHGKKNDQTSDGVLNGRSNVTNNITNPINMDFCSNAPGSHDTNNYQAKTNSNNRPRIDKFFE